MYIWPRVANRSKRFFNISTLQSIVDGAVCVCVYVCLRVTVRKVSRKTIVQKFAPFAYKFCACEIHCMCACARCRCCHIIMFMYEKNAYWMPFSDDGNTCISICHKKNTVWREKSSHKNETGAAHRSKVEANRNIAANERKSRKINFLCWNICLVCCAAPLPRLNCSYLGKIV